MVSNALSALLPVLALITAGFVLGRAGWLGPRALRHLSGLAFMVLTPAVLFRAMSRVRLEQLDLLPAAVYSLSLALVFGCVLLLFGLGRRAAVLALAATHGNSVMIGVPLIGLAWGDAGLVTLFTLVPIHSLLLLTGATVVLEFAAAREHAAASARGAAHLWRVGWRALRRALLHPVPLPIVAGLLFAHAGWTLPQWLDLPLRAMGSAFGPLALTLVGVSLAGCAIGSHLRPALYLAAAKNLLVPLLAGVLGWAFGLAGVPLAVLVVTAALPVGANVFMFAQRYAVAQDLTTASVAVSTALAAISVSLLLLWFGVP